MTCTKRCLLFILSVLVSIGLIGAVALWSAARWLHLDDKPQKSDAIVLLAGDPTRALEAAQLYREGYAPKIYVSVAIRTPSQALMDREGMAFPKLEDITRQALLQKGVPEGAISWLARGMVSTATEAQATRALVERGERRLLVVTSPYHTRRTLMIFRDALPGAELRVIANRYEPFPDAWWRDQNASVNVLLETTKLAFYMAGGRF